MHKICHSQHGSLETLKSKHCQKHIDKRTLKISIEKEKIEINNQKENIENQ